MDNASLSALINEIFDTLPGNFVAESEAMRPDLAGMQMFERPFFGVADAADPIFSEFQKLGVVGPWHKLPADWLPGAKSVVSIVFPFTERVKASNRTETFMGSMEWMHARIDGQNWQSLFLEEMEKRLRAAGVACYVPMLDGGWRSYNRGKDLEEYPGTTENTYSSNWSERHAAYAAGLGSFSLAKGFITEQGTAVRFSSIITDLALEPTPRTCTKVYDYCTMCGACVKRCPVHAISLEGGKLHLPCNLHVSGNKRGERFGCGLCETGVPCESQIPKGIKR